MARLGLLGAAALAVAAPAHADEVARWQTQVAEASARFAVPEDWISRVIRVESGGRTHAVSRAGAIGLMQLMPGTWAEMRTRLGLGADPYNPRDNILAGTFYLRLMHERFGYPGLFAAYNAGPERYADYLAGRRGLPLETKAYVASVVGPAPTTRTAVIAPDPARSSIFFVLSNDRSDR